jgi:hypothetical protein
MLKAGAVIGSASNIECPFMARKRNEPDAELGPLIPQQQTFDY